MRSDIPAGMPTARELEDQFTAFVLQFGGERVEALLPHNAGARPKNADYLLWDRTVVAELKVITADHRSDPKIGVKTTAMLKRWLSSGAARIEQRGGRRIVSTAAMPAHYAYEAMRIIAKPLKSAVATASEQVRSTKVALGLPNAKGLVLIANLADISLTPKTAHDTLDYVFRSHKSTLHSFVYFSPMLDVRQASRGEPALWMWGSTANEQGGVDSARMRELSDGWHRFSLGPDAPKHLLDKSALL